MLLQDVVAEFGVSVTADAGDHVFRQGEADRHFYILREGLLKAYYLSEDGKESIKSFLTPGDVIGSLSAVRGDGGCSFSLICLQPCTLSKVSFDRLFEAVRHDAETGVVVTEFLMTFAMKKEQREYELLCLSAEERYRRLNANRPELLTMVQQADIALYLGVTPVGLSRIKKRVEGSR